MKTARKKNEPRERARSSAPARPLKFVLHPTFKLKSAPAMYDVCDAPTDNNERSLGHLPDEDTRDIVRRMHYAAYRSEIATTPRERQNWKQVYFNLRDRVVLGNRKLVFRAIRKSPLAQKMADDLIGECDIIMIHAVAAFNPWLGIRFSTYAFTCLMRGLSRVNRRAMAKRMINFLPLDAATDDAMHALNDESAFADFRLIEEIFRNGHGVLTQREKAVLRSRFGFKVGSGRTTLETLGGDLGISKERVRQVQASAIAKLRQVLVGEPA